MNASTRLAELVESAGVETEFEKEPLLRDFLDRVDEAVDLHYRRHLGEVRLARELVGTFGFFRQRAPGAIGVRGTTLPSDATSGAGGAGDGTTLIEVVIAEQPFVVDTVELFLEFAGLPIVSQCYASLPARRDETGELTGLESSPGRPREILARFELAGQLEESFLETICASVRERLTISTTVVSDFKVMKNRLREIALSFENLTELAEDDDLAAIADAAELTHWLLGDNFVLLGLSYYSLDETGEIRFDEGRSHGHLQLGPDDQGLCDERIHHMRQAEKGLDHWVLAYKSQEEALVHRSGKVDNFLFNIHDSSGQQLGYYHLRGLFTFKAIQTLGAEVPIVRLKLAQLQRKSGYPEESLEWKSVVNAFNSIPVEYLFEAQVSEISTIVETILQVEKSKELQTHIVVDDESRRGLYFLVLPRQNYSEELRHRIEKIVLRKVGATYSDSRVFFGKFDTVLLSFFFTATDSLLEFSREQLDEQVRSVAGTWQEQLFRIAQRHLDSEVTQRIQQHYDNAFPEEYQLTTPPEEALIDVQHLEALRRGESDGIAFDVLRNEDDRNLRMCRLRVYLRKNVFLSSLLPVLDDLGLQIVDQSAVQIHLPQGGDLYLQTFRVVGIDDDDHPLVADKGMVLEALGRVFAKVLDTDALNRLITEVGLHWQDVDLLRAYVNYLRQLGVSNTFAFMSNTFRQHPFLTRLLISYYAAKFDPRRGGTLESRRQAAAAIEEQILDGLQAVPSQAADHLIRLLLNLFKSTLRTTRYQNASEEQRQRISIKVDSTALMVGSEPRPWREIFFHHHDIEGIHLRGGRLARGGLRWSERVNDYREEILGLMRTQMVKNVLIVPVGAKGGFVIRRPASDLEQRRAQADEMYKSYINGLLDITDNVRDGGVEHPVDVVCHDGEDPYLVVAADKGTAHLSDTANAISRQRGFWLDDAFASGGSNGYDHKALGITARGAWECVRRHFMELGIDPEQDVISVVGIGDMAGDVFGNGMLCSRTLQLRAAFNHMHIFLDPNPDPATSYEERLRLFRQPRSTWSDYDHNLLSPGGGVYDRNAKSIRIRPEACAMLGLSSGDLRPDDVVRAILKLDVDLLWNGGIGTYIKGEREDNRDVGDLANQHVRIDARECRARVIGEGGNLGVTQLGRVELAQRGVRLNTDFVDNSAGVNCSDHEVNLKILLAPEVSSGRLSERDRNSLLAELSDEVCAEVLSASYGTALMLSLDEVRSRHDLFSFERTIKTLVDRAAMVRGRDRMPRLEALLSRASQGRGLLRPELARLGAYVKMDVYQQLLDTPAGAVPDLLDYLFVYFSERIGERFGNRLSEHLLGREIGLTVLTNRIVDHAGATFFSDGVRETGCGVADLLRAYVLVDELFGCWGVERELLGLDGKIETPVQYEALIMVEEVIRRSVAWVLGGREGEGRLARLESEREQYERLIRDFERALPEALAAPERKRFEAAEERYYQSGVTVGLLQRLGRFTYFPAGLRVADIARSRGLQVEDVARLYFRAGHETQIFPLVRRCDDMAVSGRWESLSLRIIRNTLLDTLWSLTSQVAAGIAEPLQGGPWVKAGLLAVRSSPQFEELRIDVQKLLAEDLSIAAIQVISSRLSQAYGMQA